MMRASMSRIDNRPLHLSSAWHGMGPQGRSLWPLPLMRITPLVSSRPFASRIFSLPRGGTRIPLLGVAARPHSGVRQRKTRPASTEPRPRHEKPNYWRAITRLYAGVPVTKACWEFPGPAMEMPTPPSWRCAFETCAARYFNDGGRR